MHRHLISRAFLAVLLVAGSARASDVAFDSTTLVRMAGNERSKVTEISDGLSLSGRALEGLSTFRLQAFGLQDVLRPGWYRLRLRVRVAAPPAATDQLSFSFWCPNGVRNPATFRYDTSFAAAEFPPPGQYADLTRTILLGPSFGNYGMSLSGYKGLRIESLGFQPLSGAVSLAKVQTNKLLYGLKESGTIAVHVLNATGRPQTGRLTVTVESGLDDETCLFDREINLAGAYSGRPDVIEIALPPQPEYGHAIVATLRQGDAIAGTARDYFYTSDRAAQVGHLGQMGLDGAYTADGAAAVVERLRRFCFPLYEIVFWAPDDALKLVPPAGKDRWWSGQTLARVSTDSLKERIRIGQAQGMKVLGYVDLRWDFGFRIAEDFRRHPDFCEWDANNNDMAYEVGDIRRQLREDDAERFNKAKPNKPNFGARGVWRLASGNADVVGAHIDQLVLSTKFFGWDGWRYDDHYWYDEPAVDLLGRSLPRGGWRNPAILARIRQALEAAKPGIIYGHNMEWAQDQPERADHPMPIDTPPHPNDYYTEFLRDGGLHLQERWTAHMIDHHYQWTQVRDNLLALGHNAYRRGGYAYGLSYLNNAKPTDARYLAAFHLAGLTHLAGGINDANLGQMRLACRHADLLFGDRLVPLLDGEKILKVDAGGKELWWKRFVRYRETAPGRRVYLAHLVNPPHSVKVGEGDQNPPAPVTNVELTWRLPAGWKAVRAYQISGEGDNSIDTVVTTGPWAVQTKDFVGLGMFRKELPLHKDRGAFRVTVPNVDIWSMIALNCRGPETDVAPDVRFPLPAIPSPPEGGNRDEAVSHSPPRTKLNYDISDPRGWTRPDPDNAGKRLPLDTTPDPEASNARAARCVDGWQIDAFRPGEQVQEGTYRFRFRVKTLVQPPAGAKLSFSAWGPSNRKPPWRVERSISLENIVPDKGWQVVSVDADLGYAWENLGLQVRGGFDGLLLDRITVEEIRAEPDSFRLKTRGLTGWPAGLGLTPHEGVRIWLGDGLYSEHYRIADAVRSVSNASLAVAPHWTFREQRGFSAFNWEKPEDVAGYDLIILANVDLRTISLERRDWIRGYVQAGGSLLMLGGPYGLGRGLWHESDLIEPLLPVKLHAFDLQPLGLTSPLSLGATPGSFLSTEWPEKPVDVWLHDIEPKSGATVAMKAGDHPALVTGTYGKGRVAVLAVTPLGETPANALAWWQWPGREKLMAETIGWLVHKGSAP
jgi:hypothetical protein